MSGQQELIERLREMAKLSAGGHVVMLSDWIAPLNEAATALEANQGLREALREGIVLGFAEGSRWAGYVLEDGEYPKDSKVVADVLRSASHSFSDLYPHLAALVDQDPCPTCGGSGSTARFGGPPIENPACPCPDCTKKQGESDG